MREVGEGCRERQKEAAVGLPEEPELEAVDVAPALQRPGREGGFVSGGWGRGGLGGSAREGERWGSLMRCVKAYNGCNGTS